MGEELNNEISGLWVNKNTGVIANVSRFVMDGDNLVILTEDGQSFSGNDFSENWYKISDDNKDIEEIVKQVSGKTIYEEPINTINTSSKTIEYTEEIKPEINKNNQKAVKQLSETDKILDKIFKNCTLCVNIKSTELDIPIEAIEVAIKYLDIKRCDINDYITRNIKINLTE